MLESGLLHQLSELVGPQHLLTESADCWPYGYDNSRRHVQPDAVVFGLDHAQVCEVVRFCKRQRLPLTPRGRGTGTTGGTVPLHRGIVLSLERMDKIVELDRDNRLITVQPGVTNQRVQDAAGEYGFFWPPDPSSSAYCTVGGNLAFNAAGPRAVKYGTTRENTLALKAITGAGEAITTGVRTTKGVVGLDLTRLLIGSEGTLAIITEATLKLTPLSESKRTLQAIYDSAEAAAVAVCNIMNQAVIPCALEFMDSQAINLIRKYSHTNLPLEARALLIIEVDGLESCVDNAAQVVARAAEVTGCISVATACGEEEVRELWTTRKALNPALRNVAPDKINEDVVVPISRLPDLINGLQTLSSSHGIAIVNYGHAGNGNIHVNLLVDFENEVVMTAAERCLDKIFNLVLRLGGTLSGEHGVGLAKRDFVEREIDPTTIALMCAIKRQFDPSGILNPGKVLPKI